MIKRALQKQRGKGKVFGEPKTSRSRRIIHLAGISVEALSEHRRSQTLYRLAPEEEGQLDSETMPLPVQTEHPERFVYIYDMTCLDHVRSHPADNLNTGI